MSCSCLAPQGMVLREAVLGNVQPGLHCMCPRIDEETKAPGTHTAEPGFQSSGPCPAPQPPAQTGTAPRPASAEAPGQRGASRNPPAASQASLPSCLPFGPREVRYCSGHLPSGRSLLRPITHQLVLGETHRLLGAKCHFVQVLSS